MPSKGKQGGAAATATATTTSSGSEGKSGSVSDSKAGATTAASGPSKPGASSASTQGSADDDTPVIGWERVVDADGGFSYVNASTNERRAGDDPPPGFATPHVLARDDSEATLSAQPTAMPGLPAEAQATPAALTDATPGAASAGSDTGGGGATGTAVEAPVSLTLPAGDANESEEEAAAVALDAILGDEHEPHGWHDYHFENHGFKRLVAAHKVAVLSPDEAGHIPLQSAAMLDNADVVAELLAAGSSDEQIAFKSPDGYTALHYAVARSPPSVASVRILLRYDASLTEVAADGKTTPLKLALTMQRLDAAAGASAAGAVPKDLSGGRAVQQALGRAAQRALNHAEVVALLEDAAAAVAASRAS